MGVEASVTEASETGIVVVWWGTSEVVIWVADAGQLVTVESQEVTVISWVE